MRLQGGHDVCAVLNVSVTRECRRVGNGSEYVYVLISYYFLVEVGIHLLKRVEVIVDYLKCTPKSIARFIKVYTHIICWVRVCRMLFASGLAKNVGNLNYFLFLNRDTNVPNKIHFSKFKCL